MRHNKSWVLSILLFLFVQSAWSQDADFFATAQHDFEEYVANIPPPPRQCMSRSELTRLNEVIICQQLMNPTACSEMTNFLRQGEAISGGNLNTISGFASQANEANPTIPISNDEILQAGLESAITGGVVVGANLTSRFARALVESRRLNALLGRVFSRAAHVGQLDPADARTAATALNGLSRLGDTVPMYRNLPSNIDESFVRRMWQGVSQAGVTRAGTAVAGAGVAVAGRGMAMLFNPYVAGAFMVYQAFMVAGRVTSRILEERAGCTADDRAQYTDSFMCVTERCRNHYLACSNMLGLVMTGDLSQQEQQLGQDTEESRRLCDYMKEYLNLTDQNTNGVTLRSCPSGATGEAQVTIDGYRHVDIRGSMMNPERVTGMDSTQTMDVRFHFENGQLNRSSVYGQFGGAENDPGIRRTDYFYDTNGYMTHFSNFRLNGPAGQTSYGSMGSLNYSPPVDRTANFTRDDFIPPDNTGLFGLTQSHRDFHWARNQAYLFQGRMSQIYHEVQNCCSQGSSSCRLNRGAPINPDPDTEYAPEEEVSY